jgi:hypothetical protein
MDRVIVHFKDETTHFINIEATDIFEDGEYVKIYNGTQLCGIILASTIQMAYKTTRRDI